jgi:hypothetical protein
MAGPRKSRPVHCQGRHEDERCDGVATWRNDWTQGAGWHEPEPGYLCDKCGWAAGEKLIAELDLQYVDDGRIRGPEDVGPRLLGALDSAARDGRLSARDRAIHAVCCQRAMELNYVEIMAGSEWLAQEAGARLGRSISKTKARASRVRLENLGYLRRLTVSNITSHSLKGGRRGPQDPGTAPGHAAGSSQGSGLAHLRLLRRPHPGHSARLQAVLLGQVSQSPRPHRPGGGGQAGGGLRRTEGRGRVTGPLAHGRVSGPLVGLQQSD